MPTVAAYAAASPTSPLAPTTITRRSPGPRDVVIDIAYCGVCHSDIHQARDEWGGSVFPMVPGHEVAGHVAYAGADVTSVKVGDPVAVGCFVDSCRRCGSCRRNDEHFCERGVAYTYNGTEMDRTTPTFGGYSKSIVVDEYYVLRVPKSLDLAAAAPLLCAGITTYAPLREWNTKPGDKVAVVGLGGLGHMAVKLAVAMGAHVTVISTSAAKEADARRLGANDFVISRDERAMGKLAWRFDLIIDTVSANHAYGDYLKLLRARGTLVMVGIPPAASPVHTFSLVGGNRRLAGSNIGGIAQTQEMLDLCGREGITADVEIIPIQQINEAYGRMIANDVRYRFVIDLASL